MAPHVLQRTHRREARGARRGNRHGQRGDGEERPLDDATLYEFEDHWEQVLDYISELITNRDGDVSGRSDRLRKAEDAFRKARGMLSGSATAGVEGPTMRLIDEARRRLPSAELQAHVLKIVQSDIHKACVVNYVVVEDEEALESVWSCCSSSMTVDAWSVGPG
ncbi:hypothetical protein MMC16_005346 [Acarospora aff. strigata]|nr:hypothetical protein [Acarospora aff. strigata]